MKFVATVQQTPLLLHDPVHRTFDSEQEAIAWANDTVGTLNGAMATVARQYAPGSHGGSAEIRKGVYPVGHERHVESRIAGSFAWVPGFLNDAPRL